MSVIADMYGNNAGTIGAVLGITASIFFCVGYKLHRDRKFRLARRKSEGKIKLEDGTAIRPLSPTIDSNKGNCVIVTRDMNSIDKPEMSPNSDGEGILEEIGTYLFLLLDITAVEFNNLEINEMVCIIFCIQSFIYIEN